MWEGLEHYLRLWGGVWGARKARVHRCLLHGVLRLLGSAPRLPSPSHHTGFSRYSSRIPRIQAGTAWPTGPQAL